MTANHILTNETVQSDLPEQRHRVLGAAALLGETHALQTEPEFEPRTPQQLLERVVEDSPMYGFNIDKLEYKDQPAFAHCVHTIINRHYSAQFKFETDSEKPHAIAPPLPYQWIKSRVDTYYSEVHKGDGDKVHENTIKKMRKTYLPEALGMATALPEIEAAVEIQALLDEAGKDMAADAVGDLLVVYGVMIHFLKEKEALLRKERQEKAERAARNLGQMIQ